MVGSGIFLLPASLAAYGGISIFGWLFTATEAILLALAYARLSGIMPKTGGPYIYIQAGFGDFAGFLAAWGYWISIFVGNAAIAVGFVGYLAFFWPELASNSLLAAAVALGSIWLLTWVNAMGCATPASYSSLLRYSRFYPSSSSVRLDFCSLTSITSHLSMRVGAPRFLLLLHRRP